MFDFSLPSTAGAIGASVGAEVLGNTERSVEKLVALEHLREGGLSFLSDRKYLSRLYDAEGGVVITNADLAASFQESRQEDFTVLVFEEPQRAFAEIASALEQKAKAREGNEGIHPAALVHASVLLPASVSVGPFTVIEAGAKLGARAIVGPQVYIGAGVEIGDDCEIHAGAKIFERTRIGARTKVFAGTVIGSAGFGLYSVEGRLREMPQLGGVRIGEDVRIGANCTIDRGTLNDTILEDGCKLDDQVHVAHNCHIHRSVVLCAQVGLGGSVVIEEGAMLGGQVGLGDGVRVGKRARMGGQSGSSTNVRGDRTYFLTPATPIEDTVRIMKHFRKLPRIHERIQKLEEAIFGSLEVRNDGEPTDG